MKQVEVLAGDRVSFVVSVVPRASRNEVVGWSPAGRLKVRITAPPVDEAANQQLVRLLSKILDIQKAEVEITSGFRSKTKRLAVPRACENRLLSFTDIC